MVTQPPEPKPRGGAAKEIRTGHFIRGWLEKVGEDSIAGIRSGLVSEMGLRNRLRPRAQWLRPPTYPSFVRYFAHLRRWGLVELVREEPTEWVPHEKLLSIRLLEPWADTELPRTEVVRSTRRIYRLSALGGRPEMAFFWDDPLARGPLREALAAAFLTPQPAPPVKPPAKPAPPTAKKKMTVQEAWTKYLAGEITRKELAEYDPTVHLTPGEP